MTQRKPPGISWESWVDRQIREGIERGEFDNLPGHGKPLPDIDQLRDELWWVRQKLRREEVSVVPPTIELRRQFDDVMAQIAEATAEERVRDLVATINERIRYVNSHTVSGPPTTLAVLDVEQVLRDWRAARA